MDVRRMDFLKKIVPILRKVPLEHLYAWSTSFNRKIGLICFEFASRISTLKIPKGFWNLVISILFVLSCYTFNPQNLNGGGL